MTRTATVYTDRTESRDAGHHLGVQVRETLGDQTPDVVIVFASSRFEYEPLLTALKDACHPQLIVGSSSAQYSSIAPRCQCGTNAKLNQISNAPGRGQVTEPVDRAGLFVRHALQTPNAARIGLGRQQRITQRVRIKRGAVNFSGL